MPDESIWEGAAPHERGAEEPIQYVDESGAPEEKVVHTEAEVFIAQTDVGATLRPDEESLPPLVTAADLLEEDDPLSSLPHEPPDEETPPDDAAPAFIVTPMKGRPPRITLADGTPVGVWLSSEYPDADGGFVAEQLVVMGMDGELAAWFGKQRDRARAATTQLMADPVVAAFATEEERRLVAKKQIQDAFVKSQQKK